MRWRYAVSALIVAALIGAGVHAGPRQQNRAPSFKSQAELVVLNVTVTDRFHAYVAGLDRSAFSVSEDGQSQAIELFSAVDMPVTIGLLIDNSASMYGTRDLVAAAAGAFVQTSNRGDDVFALTFNDEVHPVLPPDVPFTNSPELMRTSLASAITMRGRTAFHDAVLRGLSVLVNGRHERRALVVVTDGGDNASVASFDDVLRRTQASNTAIYTIVLEDRLDNEGRPERLKQLSLATGGQSFRPGTIDDVTDVLKRIARDIRNGYTVGYVPPDATPDGRFHRIQVVAHDVDGHALTVRTREGYVVDKR